MKLLLAIALILLMSCTPKSIHWQDNMEHENQFIYFDEDL